MAKLGSTNIYGDLNVTGKFRVTDVSLFTGLITFENGLSGTTGYYTSNVGIAGNLNVTGSTTFSSTVTATRFISTQTTGTAPFTVYSTTAVANLNADLLDGYHLDSVSGFGGPWGFVPLVKTDGVMGIGRYIDFHHVSNDGGDYKVRLSTDGVTDGQLFINNNKIWNSGNSNLTSIPWSASTLTLNGSLSGVSTINSSGLATLGSLSTTTGIFSSTLNVSGVTTLGSSLNVSGSTVFSSTLGVNGVLTSNAGIIIEGSVNPGATNMGGFRTVGTNLILKGNSTGVSGIFFQSEKDGTNINHSSDYGFIQFHAYGVDGSSGESNKLVIGVANDTTDKLVLQTAYNNNVVVSYQDSTAGTTMPEYVVYHAGNSNLSSVDWTAKSFTSYSSGGTKSVKIYVDDNGNLVVDGNLYATGEVSAYGAGTGSTGGGGGTSYNRLDLWGDYSVDKAGYVLSAYLGNDLNSRLSAIESNGANSIVVNGSGNAITNVSKAGNLITFTKGSTFLTSIDSLIQDNLTYSTSGTTYGLSAYQGYVLNRNDITAISASTTALTLTRASGNITASIPTWNQNTTGSAGSVTNSLTLTITGGTTEGTNKYTFNGSAVKTLNFVAGSNVSIVAGSGSMTISATDTIYTHPTQTAISVGGTRHFITSLGVNTLGHVTGATSTAMTKTDIETLLTGTISTHTHQFSDLTSKPTTLSGYGITDAIVKDGDVIMNTNPFGGRPLYINSIDNAMFAADKKWYVTVTTHLRTYNSETYPKLNPSWVESYTVTGSGTAFNVSGSPTSIVVYNSDTLCSEVTTPTTQNQYKYVGGVLTFGATVTGTIRVYPGYDVKQYIDSPVANTLSGANAFDGSYETTIGVSTGYYMKINIKFNESGTAGFSGGYPYGRYFLSYYYTATPEKAEYRVYNRTYRPHIIGWKKYDFTDFKGTNANANYIQSFYDGGNYGRSEIEFIVYGHASYSTGLSQIDLKLDRPNLSVNGSTFTKYGNNKLYYDIYLGNQTSNNISLYQNGNINASGTITASSFVGNASSATKLQTSRTIWGQSFDGTGNVSGAITNASTGDFSGTVKASMFEGKYYVLDTRGNVELPSAITSNSVNFVFKFNNIVNDPPVSNGSTYAHIMNMNGWNGGNNGGGGHNSQLAFGDGLAIRISSSTSSWGVWRKFWHDGNSNLTSIPWSASTLTLNGSLVGATSGVFSSTLNVSGATNIASTLTTSGLITGNNGISSTYLNLTNNLTITCGDSDRYITFNYASSNTYDWRIGYLGSGFADANYLVFQSNKESGGTYFNALRFGLNTLDATFGGNILPETTNTKSLGSSSYRWDNIHSRYLTVYSTSTFSGMITANSGITISNGTQSITLTVDSNGVLKLDNSSSGASFYATGEVSAYGAGTGSTGGGGGSSYSRLDLWADYSVDKAGYVLSAYLGNDLNSRLSAIEGNGATLIETVGVGNAVTSVSKTGNLITFTKGSTFLTSINSLIQDNLTYSTSGTTYGLSAYQGYVLNRNDITAISASTTTLTLTRASGNITTSIPTWNQNTTGSAGSVTNSLTLTITGGTTEGTNKYTFNGSVAKTLNFVAGSNVSIVAGSGSMTISATDTIYTHPTQSAISVGGTRHFITSLGVNTLGHVTGATSTAMTKTDIESLLTGSITSHTHSYLPLSGGTLSGDLRVNARFFINSDEHHLFYNSAIGCISSKYGFAVGNNYVWHAGNFNPSNYLPLSGGTLTGLLNPQNIIFGSNTYDLSWGGFTNGKATINGNGGLNIYPLGNLFSGDVSINGNTVWHAGNLSIGAENLFNNGGKANTYSSSWQYIYGLKDDEQITVQIWCDSGSTATVNCFRDNGYGYSSNQSISTTTGYGKVTYTVKPYTTHANNNGTVLIIITATNAKIKVERGNQSTDISYSWSDYLASNVASATKLANARSIWGQLFNGEGNVSGAMTSVTSINMNGSLSGVTTGFFSGEVRINVGGGVNNALYLNGDMRFGPDYSGARTGLFKYNTTFDGLLIDTWSSGKQVRIGGSKIVLGVGEGGQLGNVIIGTDLDSGYKLDVNGDVRSNYMYFKKYNDNGVAGYVGRGASNNNNLQLFSYSGNSVYIGANENDVAGITINTSNNVGIGTISPSYKLDVNGSTRISGSLSITDTIIRSNSYAVDSDVYGNLNWKTGAENWFNWNVGGILCVFKSGNVMIGSTTDSGHKLNVNGTSRFSDTVLTKNIIFNSDNTWGNLGSVRCTWGNNGGYPTLYGSSAERWVMHINPHISYVQNGVGEYTGAMNGATIRFAGNTAGSIAWDLGVGCNSVGSDKFSIGRSESSFVSLDNAGNFGIGTTSPQFKLDVNGTSRIFGSLHLNSEGWLQLYNGNNTSTISLSHNNASSKLDIYNRTLGNWANVEAGFLTCDTITMKNNLSEKFIRSNAWGGAIRLRANSGAATDRGLQLGRVDNNLAFTSFMAFNGDSGNVSIASTLDNGYKLDVNGSGHYASELFLDYGLRISNAAGSGEGISLFAESSTNPNYGLMFARTIYKGTHGAVNGDWATYFTMSPDAGRGWIFTSNAAGTGGNVASISNWGNLTCSGEVTAYSASDIRLKTNIKPIMSAIDVINKLNPVQYNWNNKAKELNPLKTDSIEYGLIAQELEVVMPELVHTIYDKYKSIDYVKLVPILIKAMQEQQIKIENLERLVKQNRCLS